MLSKKKQNFKITDVILIRSGRWSDLFLFIRFALFRESTFIHFKHLFKKICHYFHPMGHFQKSGILSAVAMTIQRIQNVSLITTRTGVSSCTTLWTPATKRTTTDFRPVPFGQSRRNSTNWHRNVLSRKRPRSVATEFWKRTKSVTSGAKLSTWWIRIITVVPVIASYDQAHAVRRFTRSVALAIVKWSAIRLCFANRETMMTAEMPRFASMLFHHTLIIGFHILAHNPFNLFLSWKII